MNNFFCVAQLEIWGKGEPDNLLQGDQETEEFK